MNRKDLSEAVGGISSRHVQEAEDYFAAAYRKSNGSRYRKILAAAMAACILGCAAMVCLPTAARSLKGYFQDVLRWDGAVTGLMYQEGADEITICVVDTVSENGTLTLPLQIQLPDTEEPPFGPRYIRRITLGDYRITDASGREICSSSGRQDSASGILEEHKALAGLLLEREKFTSGHYVLEITSVYALQKAEQPLEIKGHWECPFAVDEDVLIPVPQRHKQ